MPPDRRARHRAPRPLRRATLPHPEAAAQFIYLQRQQARRHGSTSTGVRGGRWSTACSAARDIFLRKRRARRDGGAGPHPTPCSPPLTRGSSSPRYESFGRHRAPTAACIELRPHHLGTASALGGIAYLGEPDPRAPAERWLVPLSLPTSAVNARRRGRLLALRARDINRMRGHAGRHLCRSNRATPWAHRWATDW